MNGLQNGLQFVPKLFATKRFRVGRGELFEKFGPRHLQSSHLIGLLSGIPATSISA
jgi:hypothetical protein